jgi:hypothetical protein
MTGANHPMPTFDQHKIDVKQLVHAETSGQSN